MSPLKCYCGTKLRDGVCLFRCPAEAAPRHLRAQEAKRRKATFDSNRTKGELLQFTEVQDAAARVSPVEARNRALFTRNKSPSARARDARRADIKRKRIEKLRAGQ